MLRAPFVFALVVLAAVAAAMRKTPLPECALTIDAAPVLRLNDPSDRRRLTDELTRVDVIAGRFRERIRADPPASMTAHALKTHATRPDRAYRYCQTILREQVAKAHGLTISDLPAPADSDRVAR